MTEGMVQNGTCQHHLGAKELLLLNGCCQHLFSLDELQFLAASWGGSPRSASVSAPHFFQNVTSALDLGMCKSLCESFMNRDCGFHRPLTLLKVYPIGLQIQMFGDLTFWCRTFRLGILMWGSEASFLGDKPL